MFTEVNYCRPTVNTDSFMHDLIFQLKSWKWINNFNISPGTVLIFLKKVSISMIENCV